MPTPKLALWPASTPIDLAGDVGRFRRDEQCRHWPELRRFQEKIFRATIAGSSGPVLP
jgi:hypothetical protein